MYCEIRLTFDSYAEFVRSMTPEAIDELMRAKDPWQIQRVEEPVPKEPPVWEDWPGTQLVQEERTADAAPPETPEPVIVPPEPEKPAETPTAPETSVDITEVRKLLTQIARAKGKEASKELLVAAGAEKLTDVAPDRLPGLLAAAKEVIADA